MSITFEIKPTLQAAINEASDYKTPYQVLEDVGSVIARKTNNLLYAIVTGSESYDPKGKQQGTVTNAMTIAPDTTGPENRRAGGGRLLEVVYPYDKPWGEETRLRVWDLAQSVYRKPIKTPDPQTLENAVAAVLASDTVQEWMAELLKPTQ